MAMSSVCVVNLQGAYLSAVYGIKEILECAVGISPSAFSVTILDEEGFIAARRRFDFVVIPPFRPLVPRRGYHPSPRVLAALSKAIARGSIPASVCAGAYYLCATGIADGKTVTTHWNLASDLARRFPSVRVREERVLVDGETYLSAGGVTSFQDLSLHLVRKVAGPETSLAVAREFLINPGDRTQLQFARVALENPGDGDVVSRAKAFMRENLNAPLTLAGIADAVGVTERTLLRRFAANGHGTPAAYLLSARLAHARSLLESSDVPVKRVAAESGYGDLAAFARAFRKYAGLAPGEYRKSFRIP